VETPALDPFPRVPQKLTGKGSLAFGGPHILRGIASHHQTGCRTEAVLDDLRRKLHRRHHIVTPVTPAPHPMHMGRGREGSCSGGGLLTHVAQFPGPDHEGRRHGSRSARNEERRFPCCGSISCDGITPQSDPPVRPGRATWVRRNRPRVPPASREPPLPQPGRLDGSRRVG
jgi:hypothetical protein